MVIIKEVATGTKWNLRKTNGARPGRGRDYWCAYMDGPNSAGRPGVIGFYVTDLAEALENLGDCTVVDC